jgi:F-type H+-transporting ATPase subunit gamma
VTDTIETLRRKLEHAGELKSVVRTMKALAASSIVQYERAVRSLRDYDRAVELGLVACLRQADGVQALRQRPHSASVAAIVFGSDQGLVGQFNDRIARYTAEELGRIEGKKIVWAIGERVRARLDDAGLAVARTYAVPQNVHAITPLVTRMLIDNETARVSATVWEVHVFHHAPLPGAGYAPTRLRLLPLDAEWERRLRSIQWPTPLPPQVLDRTSRSLLALIEEYLFVSLFRACAESLAAENASRLAAMQRAERNIADRLTELRAAFNERRQTGIDEELFDVIAGFEAVRR